MKSILQPCKESLNNKPCLVVIVLHVIWYDEFGIIPVWNAASDRMISQIIPDVFCIIALVCIH